MRFERKHQIPFTLLSDPDSRVIRQLNLLNETIEPGSRYHGVPWPGIFLLDAERQVVARFAEEDYRERPLLEDLESAARHFVAGAPSE